MQAVAERETSSEERSMPKDCSTTHGLPSEVLKKWYTMSAQLSVLSVFLLLLASRCLCSTNHKTQRRSECICSKRHCRLIIGIDYKHCLDSQCRIDSNARFP